MANSYFEEVVKLTNDMDPLIKKFEKLTTKNDTFLNSELKRLKGYQSFMEKINNNLCNAIKTRSTAEARSLKEIAERTSNNHKEIMSLMKKRSQAERDLYNAKTKEEQDIHRQRIQNLASELETTKETEQMEKKNAQNIIDGLTKYQRAIDNMNGRVRGTIFDPQVGFFGSGAKLKDMDKNVEFMETRMVGMADTVGDAFSGSLDSVQSRIDKLGRGAGSFIKDLSTAAKMKKAEKGGGGGMALNLMSKLSGVGTLLTGLTAGFGALFAIFKVMQAVEEKIKAVNSELLDTYGASDLVASGMTNVYDSVNQIRKELSDPNFANGLGVTLEEARKLAYTFNDIGISFGSLQDDGLSLTDSVTKLKEMTTVFQASAKTLGVDFSALVGFGKEFRQELGVSVKEGKYLERMSQEFGRIRDLAKQSSLNTKDFFGVIQDLSQGIGTMNIRIGEAATLFVNLQKVLGPQAAQAFVKGLAGGFKGEGIQDRFKRIILTGGMKKVMKRSAEDTKKDFFSLFAGGKLDKVLGEAGVNKNTNFAKMTDAELEKAMGVLRRKGGTEGEGAARQLMKSVRLARGGEGGLSAQALALGDLDMTGALSAQMKQLYSVTGGKGFRDVTAIEMEKISQMTGKSIEDLEGMRHLDMAMREDFRVLQEVQSKNTSETGARDADKIKKALEEQGLTGLNVDKEGNITDKSGRQIKDIQDYIASQGAVIDAKEGIDAQLDQVALLQEVVEATMTSADMINNHLGGLIQGMSDPINALAGRFVFGTRRKKLAKARELRGEIKGDTKQLQKDREKERKRAGAERLRIDKIRNKKKREEAQKAEEETIKRKEKGFKKQQLEIEIKSKQASLLAQNRTLAKGDESGKAAAIAEISKKGGDTQKRVEESLGAKKSLEAYLQSEGVTKEQLMTVVGGGQIKDHTEATGFIQEWFGGSGRDPDDLANEEKIKKIMKLYNIKTLAKLKNDPVYTGGTKTSQQSAILQMGSGQSVSLDQSAVDGMAMDWSDTKVNEGKGGSHDKDLSKTLVKEAKKTEDKQIEGITTLNSEIAATKEEIKKLSESPADITKRAQLESNIQAKNAALRDMNVETHMEAILKARKKDLSNTMKGTFKGEGDLSTQGGRKSYIDQIDAKVKKLEAIDADQLSRKQKHELQNLLDLRDDFRMYYAQDASLSPGGGTPFIGNAGSLVQGTETDTAMLVDFTKAKGGGRGGGDMYVTINGNNEQAMLASLESHMKSMGFIG
jgi:hypothetical protein